MENKPFDPVVIKEELDSVYKLNQKIAKLTRQRDGILEVLIIRYGAVKVDYFYNIVELEKGRLIN